jgi:hypothetical protein
MNLNTLLFPRQLEADGLAEKIREALMARKKKLRLEGKIDVPVLSWNEALAGALRKARLQRRVRVGFEDILDKLAAEKKGIEEIRQKEQAAHKDRISRLLLVSNDGAERLYRHIEQTITDYSPRILGCLLDLDSRSLGQFIVGGKNVKGTGVKVILVEHKDAVSDVLRSLIEKP